MRAHAIAAALLTVAASYSPPALAQSGDEWQFQVILYGYLPKISGTTDFSLRGGSSDLTVHPDAILKSLNGVFMGMAEASRGPWGLYTDLMYLDVGNTTSETRDFAIGGIGIPASVSANLDFNVRGTVWTLAGTYQVMKEPEASLQVIAGARLLDVDQSLGVQFNGDLGPLNLLGRQFNLDTRISDWDGIVGVKGRLAFGSGRQWFVPYYVDVGTGQSDLTWQVIGGLGYSFHWGDVIFAWRYLDYNMKSGSKIESINFNGPGLGVAFRW